MARWKAVIRTIIYPRAWVLLLGALIAAAGLIFVFAGARQETWLAYPVYVWSAYMLAVICVRLWRSVGLTRQSIDAALDRAPVVRRYFSDVSFKMQVSLYFSFGLNTLYALMKLGFGVYYRSVWFGTLAGYYLLLAVTRFALVRYASRSDFGADPAAEWKRYRLCGGILLVMNLALSGMVIMVVRDNEGFHYPGFLIYIMAMYAFYNMTAAVVNVVRYRRYRSPVMSAAKVLQLTAALVSMLALETAMLAQFGGASGARFRELMTGCTGGVVCVAVLVIAVYMLRRKRA